MGNQATSLRPEALADLEQQTAFTAAEIREFYRQFLKGTDNMRMSMSKEDFVDEYKKIFPKGDATHFAEIVFKNFDKDNNGRLDFREFLSSVSIQQRGSMDEKLEWTFNLYDMDDSGYITSDELLEMSQSLLALKSGTLPKEDQISPKKLTDHILEHCDKNKDNRISKAEFKEGAMSSTTMQALLVGTVKASSSPFTRRKNPPPTGAQAHK